MVKFSDANHRFRNRSLCGPHFASASRFAARSGGGKGQAEAEEGCLSIPGVLGPVVRKERITVEAYDLSGEAFCGEMEGLLARIVQHEVDHLDGKLFIDRLAPGQAAELREALEEFEIDYRSKCECGEMPSGEAIAARLAELEKLRA